MPRPTWPLLAPSSSLTISFVYSDVWRKAFGKKTAINVSTCPGGKEGFVWEKRPYATNYETIIATNQLRLVTHPQ